MSHCKELKAENFHAYFGHDTVTKGFYKLEFGFDRMLPIDCCSPAKRRRKPPGSASIPQGYKYEFEHCDQ